MRDRSGALPRVLGVCLALALSGSAVAIAAGQPADPVLARVDGTPIHLSDVTAEAARLPANLQAMPPATLYPMLLTRMIDARALVITAKRKKLQDDPVVRRQVAAATEEVLENALLSREVKPQLTEAALRAVYDKTIAGKPGAEQVHARHILVPTKAQAEKIIAELGKGADFAALAKKYSKDPGAANGGDLGFFSREEMVPAFATAAFALKPGEYTKTPVHTQFGWHVIQLLARRRAPAPSFAEAEPGLRQKVLKAAVEKAVAEARKGVKVETFPKAMPQAAPAAAAH